MKKQKEVERPPWRATISTAAQPKVDKNALLKAKLLDASRRIARAQRNPTVGTQTDKLHTKLFKEVSIGAQKDLILKKDQECLTDGTITVKDKSGNFLLTHSVSQMTDAIQSMNIGTQTVLPRSSVAFNRYIKKLQNLPNANLEKFKENDLRLRRQIDEIKKLDEILNNSSNNTNVQKNIDYQRNINVNENVDNKTNAFLDNENFDFETDSISDNDNENSPKCSKPTSTSSTRSYWNDIDFSSDEENYPKLPKKPIGSIENPLNDFKELVLGQRLSEMRLSPIPPRKRRPNLKQVTWSDTQHRMINELVSEASALMDMFDKVTMLLGPDIKLNELPKIQDPRLPPFKMDPILKNSCDVLEEQLNKIKPVKFAEIEKLDPELLKYVNGYNPDQNL